MYNTIFFCSCPFFRNELGGEGEREVSLTQRTQAGQISTLNNGKLYHRPRMAYGISVLEFKPGKTHWTEGICPENYSKLIETVDEGDLYYRAFFFGQGKKIYKFLFILSPFIRLTIVM